MGFFDINIWAVLGSAVSAMVIGAIWYGPFFGKVWMRGMGWNPDDAAFVATMKAKAGPSYAQMFIGALLTALVFAYMFGNWWSGSSADQTISGIFYGILVWTGFALPIIYGKKLWEGKAFKYVAVDLGYYLVSLCATGVIIALTVNVRGGF